MIPKQPEMLLSYLNTKLRDQYDSLDLLCDDLDVSKDEILETMRKIEYYYDETLNQFTCL